MRKINLYRVGRLALTIALLLMIGVLALPTHLAQAVSQSEGFDGSVVPPAGWVRRNRSSPLGPSAWTKCGTGGSIISLGFYGGNGSCASVDFNSASGTTATISNWLISPLITTLKNNDIISFYTRTVANSQFPDHMEVRLSTNGACSPGTTVFSIGDFTRVLVDINPTQDQGGYPPDWKAYSIPLSGITGTVSGCVAFRYYVTEAGSSQGNGYIVAIDEFRYQDSQDLATATATITITRTATFTPTPSPTRTPTPTASNTYTPSATYTLLPPRMDTIGVYKDGTWYLRNTNAAGEPDIVTTFAPGSHQQNLFPVPGDWNGDGVDTVGVYDNFSGVFYLSDSNSTPAINYSPVFGNPFDTPLHGRWYNGALHDGVGVFRPSNGIIYLKNELTTGFDDFFMVMGNPGDSGVAGDWNYDGVDTIGVYRPSNQTWYLSNTNGHGITFSDVSFEWLSSDRVFSGDWDADGITNVGYMNYDGGVLALHLANTTGAGETDIAFGPAGAYPVAGHWTAAGRPPQPNSAIFGSFPPTRSGTGNTGGIGAD